MVTKLIPRISLKTPDILHDYSLAVQSRAASVIGRREVMGGRAKFGIFGDGKEVPQLALAHAARPGDWRAGYYRDQTIMLALGLLTVRQFFAQLYAHADAKADPHSAGRQMDAHFATRFLNPDGSWRDQMQTFNSSADLSPTGSQMPRLVGLGYASRLYRELEELHDLTQFSHHGDEVAFGTIGNATCAEGMFWESVNAVCVLHAPVVISIWDDGYGISVPNEIQIAKPSLSELLSGFRRERGGRGLGLYTVPAWDYVALIEIYEHAAETARRDHTPAIIHVTDVTQPQGHSTSGSQERYKSPERLAWEEQFDCNRKLREWMIKEEESTAEELDRIEAQAAEMVEAERAAAWEAFSGEIAAERAELLPLLEAIEAETPGGDGLAAIGQALLGLPTPMRKDVASAARRALFATRGVDTPARHSLKGWADDYLAAGQRRYSSHLVSETSESARSVVEVKPDYGSQPVEATGFQVLSANFDALLARDPRVVAFGEDLGKLGDVNQGFAGLQAKYGPLRVADTGIREATILGQAIGLAQRGLRPIAEIQYLDYLLYALQIMSDDLATLHWRTAGGQKAPVIVRTRGHRLEGVWHSGSPMGAIIHLLRGMNVLAPRNMTQAAGFYNTLLRSDEPGLIVEVLNAYRLHEKMPANLGEFTTPVGVPEVVRPGADVTLVTYGACVPVALEAAGLLAEAQIDTEVIDVRSLVPFDIRAMIVESLKKTSRIVFLDEDVPGGASGYMLQQVIEAQGGYHWLDAEPRTLTAQPHRPAYGSDGNYFSKPGVEDVVETVYALLHDSDPKAYPAL
jgi:pyruvate/2-oxoglutarate/acetoin dehydrogenase E1 component/TPP-dependent pyruvate/acetoin dehydrogenase alpha subunit